jgi:hypothetical protein
MKDTPPWTVWMATALAGALAVSLLWPRILPGPSAADDALSALSQRATRLREVSDPVERDRLCTPLAAYCRALDRTLAPDARVFVSGILGKENGTRIGVFYFLRNYLFPRTVEISRDGRPQFHETWFDGVPGDSAEQLRADGFDLLVRFAPDGKRLEKVPLTQRGEQR